MFATILAVYMADLIRGEHQKIRFVKNGVKFVAIDKPLVEADAGALRLSVCLCCRIFEKLRHLEGAEGLTAGFSDGLSVPQP